MSKRSAGEGTVFQGPNGRWVAMIELPRGGDGKRRRRLWRARTQKEAQRLLKEMRAEPEASGGVANARRTVAEAIVDYRATRPASAHDDWVFGLVADGLGAHRIAKLSVRECDQFLRSAAVGLNDRRPIGKAQLTRIRQNLVALITNEQRLGHVLRNVVDLSELPEPGAPSREQTALTVEELDQLISEAKGWPLALIELAGRNGLRLAEARALRWADLDLDAGLLTVSGQNNRANQRADVKRANNAARTIHIDRRTLDSLNHRRGEQAAEVTAGAELGLVVATRVGTSPDRHMAARAMRNLCKEAKVSHITPYELRHTAITHQADAGWTSFEIADWAGTSEQMISERYRHRLRRVSRLRPDEAPGMGVDDDDCEE
jgi:integrase